MATIGQIRGMLLEEAVLQLLRTAGYTPIEDAGNDPTLRNGPSGLEIIGRGGKHQLDAIADPRVSLPFSNPQRLVIEAKCYSPKYPVDLPIVRNAVGVIKDISEFWVPPSKANDLVSTSRYHYQYSIFSASGYTGDAERYAFAQDIYLIQYQRSLFMAPVIDAMRQLTHLDFDSRSRNQIDVNLSHLRREVRRAIRNNQQGLSDYFPPNAYAKIIGFIEAVSNIGGTLIAIAGSRFPIHLIPSPQIRLNDLEERYRVHISWDDHSWYLNDDRDRRLFSFDLPPELFSLYTEHGILTRSRALDLKAETLREMQSILVIGHTTRVVTFELDMDWVVRVRERLQQFR